MRQKPVSEDADPTIGPMAPRTAGEPADSKNAGFSYLK